MRHFIISMTFLLATAAGFAANPSELWVKANKAYNAGAFAEASDLYLKITDAGYESAELFYNTGNAFFKQQDYARAILWYERAKRLDPSAEDINFNLNVANTKISDKIEPIPELFYKRWFKSVVFMFSVDTWASLSIIILLISMAGFVLYLLTHLLILRKIGFWSGTGLLVLSLFFLLLSYSGNHFQTSATHAIIFAPTITVKSSPDEKSTDLFVIHEGTKVLLLDNISGWYEIRLANGSVGWLPQTALEKI